MKVEDVRDLFAYLKTLPALDDPQQAASDRLPLQHPPGCWAAGNSSIWTSKPFTPDPSKSATWNRGAYLVEGPGHCAECHSPRDALGGIIPDQRFAGGIDAEGKGWVPNITPHADGIASWKKAGHGRLPAKRHDAGRSTRSAAAWPK